jgi:TIR- and PNP-associating SLOG family
MKLRGRRVHIVGSAAPETEEQKLVYSHELVAELTRALAAEGATFVASFGPEPLLAGRMDGPSIIFDWTVAEEILASLRAGLSVPSSPDGRLIATLATAKTDAKIPSHRRSTFDALRNADAVDMYFVEPGWNSGAYRRQRLAQLGDILIGVSGGEGVEHQAVVYSSKGKPVIPLDVQLGASQHDGSGGAARLFQRALAGPQDFFRVLPGNAPAELLDRTRTRDGSTSSNQVVLGIIKLLQAVEPPLVFCVRLLNDALPEFPSVEGFFRDTVDPFIDSLGYQRFEMGIDKHEFAWMNEAIFSKLHHSAVVLIDLTALRPNCFMELGYALGNTQRVIVTARNDTKIPFDAHALESFVWKEGEPLAERLSRLESYWQRNINRPPLVAVRQAK